MTQGSGLLPPDPEAQEEIDWFEGQEHQLDITGMATGEALPDGWLDIEFEDEEIPDDRRFTLPGYDPDDFTDLD